MSMHIDARALVGLQCDHITRTLVPAFYRYLREQDPVVQAKEGQGFNDTIHGLVVLFERAEREVLGDARASGVGEEETRRLGLGLWIEGGELGLTDVMVGPWLFRANIALKHYRGFVFSFGDEFNGWIERLFNHPAFKVTCSNEHRYIEAYERKAHNRSYIRQVVNGTVNGKL